VLPAPPQPIAAYVPARLVPIGGDRALVFLSGQISSRDGSLITGRVPDQITVEQAQEAARACALNLLAQIESAVGLDKVEQLAQLTGFVNCSDDFQGQPEVLNGASDLLVEVLGEAGRHTRAAVGSNSLPRGAAVELAAIVVTKL
jgi:enamine deaminase RidA (YjgF/YER057c/UK114 family)